MNKKAIETLRNGLEDSHWYSDDDEKVFDELVIKAKAWDNMKRDFEEISHTPMAQHILFNMSIIKERVESGESDVKK